MNVCFKILFGKKKGKKKETAHEAAIQFWGPDPPVEKHRLRIEDSDQSNWLNAPV